jgi:hypothetical protein
MPETFRTLPTPAAPARVDHAAHILHGVAIAQAGEAAGHHLLLDETSLSQLLALAGQQPRGVKCRFTHRPSPAMAWANTGPAEE